MASEETDDRGKEDEETSILEESRSLIRDGGFREREKNCVIANREGKLGRGRLEIFRRKFMKNFQGVCNVSLIPYHPTKALLWL